METFLLLVSWCAVGLLLLWIVCGWIVIIGEKCRLLWGDKQKQFLQNTMYQYGMHGLVSGSLVGRHSDGMAIAMTKADRQGEMIDILYGQAPTFPFNGTYYYVVLKDGTLLDGWGNPTNITIKQPRPYDWTKENA